MLSAEFATSFAQEWISAWNAHDLPRILSHYEDDFEMSSPLIRTLVKEGSCTLKGKEAVGAYWSLALTRMPTVHFTLEQVLVGANSLTLVYQGARGTSAEVFYFDRGERVSRAFAHYALND